MKIDWIVFRHFQHYFGNITAKAHIFFFLLGFTSSWQWALFFSVLPKGHSHEQFRGPIVARTCGIKVIIHTHVHYHWAKRGLQHIKRKLTGGGGSGILFKRSFYIICRMKRKYEKCSSQPFIIFQIIQKKKDLGAILLTRGFLLCYKCFLFFKSKSQNWNHYYLQFAICKSF